MSTPGQDPQALHLDRLCDLYLRSSRAYETVRRAHMAARREARNPGSLGRVEAADLESLASAEARACQVVAQCSVAIAAALSESVREAVERSSRIGVTPRCTDSRSFLEASSNAMEDAMEGAETHATH